MAQGYNARLDESLGAKHGKKSTPYAARRRESEVEEEKIYGHKYGSDGNMEYRSVGDHLGKLIKK